MTHPYAARPVAATHVWLTPPTIIHPLGQFDLDPCAAPSPRPWATARTMWAPPINGLASLWFGRVWLNPPFGKHTAARLERMAAHGHGTALCFARTETRMFFDHVWNAATAIMFLAGRPNFCGIDGAPAKGNSGGPIVLIAYGALDADRLSTSGLRGRFIDLT